MAKPSPTDVRRRFPPWIFAGEARALLIGLGLLGVLVARTAGCRPLTREEQRRSERKAQESRDAAEIESVAEAAVKECLRWPHDASFVWFPEIRRNDDRTKASVIGKVTAKNTFGAALTHEYVVLLARQGDNWIVNDVAVGDELVYSRRPAKPEPPKKVLPPQRDSRFNPDDPRFPDD